MPKHPLTPHDRFFKAMMSNKAFAIDFCKEMLPEQIRSVIDLESLSFPKTSFINKELREFFSDVILRFRRKTSSDQHLHVTLIIEHKEKPYSMVYIQLLRYLAEGYTAFLKQDKPLEPILPVLLYQGRKKWNVRPISELIDQLPDGLKKYIPQFEILFLDVARMDDKMIENITNVFVRSALYIQKYRTSLPDKIDQIIHIFKKMEILSDRNLMAHIFVYFAHNVQFSIQTIDKIMTSLPTTTQKEFKSIYDHFTELGMEKGLQKGLQKGREEGKVEGIQEGMNQTKIATILRGYDSGLSIELIAELVDMKVEEVKRIIDNHYKK